MRVVRLALVAGLVLPAALESQQLTPAERARIDSAATAVLAGTGAPSASIAVVRGGAIVYEQAYGTGRIEPNAPATPSMRYAIGSVSKQFTAAAILLLAEEGKLSLDDKVSKWHEHLTRPGDITLRQLLTMTSGYQDYWPQDYVMPPMLKPTSTHEILHEWAGKALDFEPGTKWQYSNTNYVMLGEIVEKVAGMPLMDFLRQRIFTPLGMTSVADINEGPLGARDASPVLRNALGPWRLAPKEGKGWLFGAGQLAMTAHDLATWDISIINRSLLRPASYKAQQTSMLLENGVSTGYGLGMNVSAPGGRKRLSHGGAVSGYTTQNEVYPDDKVAIVVYTNIYPGAAGAPSQIAARIANVLFGGAMSPASLAAREQAMRIYEGLMQGTVDRSLFTANANAYFTDEVIADYSKSLEPLGMPATFLAGGESLRGGMTIRSYRIVARGIAMDLTTMTMPDGKIEQYIVARAG